MKHNVVTPSVGESITEVGILKWHKQTGQAVKNGELICEIESDKATVELVAPASGVITILKLQGERLPIGAQIAVVDDAGKATVAPTASAAAAAPSAAAPPSTSGAPTPGPAARKMAADQGVDLSAVNGTGKDGRVTKGDIQSRGAAPAAVASAPAPAPAAKSVMPAYVDRPGDRRVPMTMLRQKIAERLVFAQHTAAILTTFNECDMTEVIKLRNEHKDKYKAKHGVPLSFMSFFTRAVVESLKLSPEVNASLDGKDVVYHDYLDIGVAVGTERGLVVPVIRDAAKLGFVDIDKRIGEMAIKARDGKLSIADMSGGTFTISNGGTYGSLLSTPILNPPQSGILGMHKTMDRPMAVNGKIEIRPMMYLALSYDHRLIDGKGAVTFLVQVKDFIENPSKLGFKE